VFAAAAGNDVELDDVFALTGRRGMLSSCLSTAMPYMLGMPDVDYGPASAYSLDGSKQTFCRWPDSSAPEVLAHLLSSSLSL
jgi:hypothetical protein